MGVNVREKVTGSGVWWVFVTHQGRRTSRRVGTKKAAEKTAEQIQAKLTLGQEFLKERKHRRQRSKSITARSVKPI